MKRKKHEEPENSERWLLTYSDLITLLMAFFIVMYASSTVSKEKFAQIAQSLKVGFNGASGKTVIGNQDAVDIKSTSSYVTQEASKQSASAEKAEENKLKDVKKKIDQYVNQNGMQGSVSTNLQEKGLVVSIVDTLMFDTGRAEVKPDFQKKLVEIGEILKTIDNYIRIEGHTDNTPISNSQYASNIELGSARSNNVEHLFIDVSKIPVTQMYTVSYADTRPVADNNSEAGKARNRRVDIVILNSKFNAVEQESSGK
ncbi:chemotaxis protein MotB [Clostridium acetobutylicum]|uniref:Chemotaxis motility protein B, gene motB n=1 Tax=Clostridium acetobutylicum (strain ATCC 824 / DSM 792 / JCM 1419 / IAM 19013 / LMG 5710 / NBRC 13948 / NRRL B-527 / VKM B-1787 / 2291 / W) TaxID=272562 RepID=Q97M93_CLOAB|nr:MULTISPECIES: flagellar motor protein MotB [Clostridium]AAK78286.1 Chemotaxis motility protein B, gene motB [Clostridium acetobutylicum ATCC 824]ADZ19353.1 Chemotaxis motility protein B, gene motB [Clostridium acetobutylicum EA 2018]AEI33842.1 chemotaxis motility protein B, motB [Clostridium acetobutylicum DSM 1731]AWV80012.1 chemotaxis protein MotA [Clostridium acetobutylicum]MBC2395828.1 flagellar motor protein MotB [Clostridium acetobutylicum]